MADHPTEFKERAADKDLSKTPFSEATPEAVKYALATDQDPVVVGKVSHLSQLLFIWVSGIALFSDGYNAQISKLSSGIFSVVYGSGWNEHFSG